MATLPLPTTPATVNVSLRRGSVRATNIKGDVSVDGRVDDTNISDVSGEVRLSGDFFGQMNLAKVAKGVSFRSSRTDMRWRGWTAT